MAHIHEKIDFTVSIFIVRDASVLLHVHKKLGMWLPPGGHIELDEDPNEAALREVKEEAGLEVELVGEAPEHFDGHQRSQELIRPRFLQKHFFDESQTHQHIDSIYFATVVPGTVQSEFEEAEVRWFTKNDIDATPELLPDVRKYCLIALQELA